MPIHGYPGGVISATPPTVSVSSASGVWTTEKQLQYQAQGVWPPGGVYPISRSLRFNSADAANLTRTPASAGNRRTWTWSAWVKNCLAPSNDPNLFGAGDVGVRPSVEFSIYNSFDVSRVSFLSYNGGGYDFNLRAAQSLRDPSAWYHIVVAFDTTQATNTDRIKIYINNVQITTWNSATWPSQNFDGAVSNNVRQVISTHSFNASGSELNGYMTEINFIGGQALTPSSFGETNAATGVWQPKAYTGTYGTNGYYLNFSDNSGTTSTTLGKDYSGNGNNWTPNNFSVTAGAGNDSLVDTPTSFGSDTGVGGEVRGNYCTMNPLNATNASAVNGNLDVTLTSPGSTIAQIRGTIAPSTGKWYWENVITSDGNQSTWFGVVAASTAQNANLNSGQSVNQVIYARYDGTKIVNGTSSSYGSSYTTGDVIGVALDLDGGTVTFYKNNTSQGSISLPTTGIPYAPVYWWSSSASSGASTFNFGQRAFTYTAPSGFKALCTQNLPTPTVVQGDDYFNPVLYTGDGTNNRFISAGMTPDWTWIKERGRAASNFVFDTLRGAGNYLSTNQTGAENFAGNLGWSNTGPTTDGFKVDAGTNDSINYNTGTYVAWNWKANGAGVTNTAGSITSTVSSNTTSGFSIVTYTGNLTAGATVGHGLGAAPQMVVVKERGATRSWIVYHASVGATKFLTLNTTDAEQTYSGMWNNTAPSSTVFTIGSDGAVNTSSGTYVAYCFAAIPGFSAFGSYTGNGSSDGPFVYLGFRPSYILIKRTDSADDWTVMDSARNTYNAANSSLFPNGSYSETTDSNRLEDFLSNGFKVRSGNLYINASGGTFIYAAFASNPFKYALAR